jgi:hypothetical protein
MRDVGTIRSYVRDFLDLEEDDMGSTLIDTWIMEGFRKIVRTTRRWPYFEDAWTVPTVADTREITLDADVEEIASIEGPYGLLRKTDEGAARDDYNTYTGAPTSGTPAAYSKHANVVRLYPTPSEVVSLRVLGYRAPTAWMTGASGDLPDFPEDCEDALLAWVMHRAYTHQDDTELAAFEAQRFQSAVDEMVGHHVQDDLGAPLVIGGGRRKPRMPAGERPIPWGS